MSEQEAQQAIERKSVVQFIDEPDRWGIITCLSDDGSTAYINPRGASSIRISATLNKIELG